MLIDGWRTRLIEHRSSDSGEDGYGDDDDEQMDVDEPADDDNPYPLEGKYKNSADRAKCVGCEAQR